MVNVLQLIGDLLHLISFVIIIFKIIRERSSRGVSSKTFELYLVVFLTRYLDLFMYFISIYNTVMKLLFITATIFIIYLLRKSKYYSLDYDRIKEDSFPHVYLVPFALVMTLLIHKDWTWWGLTWSFSLWLESVAVFPQITIINKNKGTLAYIAHYLAALGSYRFFYILLWIYRFIKYHTLSWVSIFSGTLQVLLYADFFYLYVKNYKQFITSDLPTVCKVPESKEKNAMF